MTVLLLGVGYIGAALLARVLAAGERVVALDNNFATDWLAVERLAASQPRRCTFLRGDLRSRDDVRAAFAVAASREPISAVYLLATQASGHADAAPAEYTEDTNLRGPRHVLDVALSFGRPPVVFGSSFHVYGGSLAGEIDESQPYGLQRDLSHLSKIYVEKLGELYAAQHGQPFAPVRLGIVYGLGPVVKRDLRFVTVPHAFCLRALAREPLEIHAGVAAPAAFVHLNDAVTSLCLAATPFGYAPANAATEVATVTDVARLVQQAASERGLDVAIRSAGPGEPAPAAFTVRSRLTAQGWQPTRRLADSIGGILDHYRECS